MSKLEFSSRRHLLMRMARIKSDLLGMKRTMELMIDEISELDYEISKSLPQTDDIVGIAAEKTPSDA